VSDDLAAVSTLYGYSQVRRLSSPAAAELVVRRRRAEAVGQEITAVALVVRDYDEALAFFTGCLRFMVVEDTPLEGGKRWVVVRPPGSGTALLLARAATPEQVARVGDQTGGRVFLFLRTDDFWRDYREMQARGVRFATEPREEVYGTVAVFLDLYGNLWDLIEPRRAERDAATDRPRDEIKKIGQVRLSSPP
jgi:catechol 2,3-dioxygenase-like lactoylglutathione lyase family enzyme